MNLNMNKVRAVVIELFEFDAIITHTEVIETDQGSILKVHVEHSTHPDVLDITISLPYEQYI